MFDGPREENEGRSVGGGSLLAHFMRQHGVKSPFWIPELIKHTPWKPAFTACAGGFISNGGRQRWRFWGWFWGLGAPPVPRRDRGAAAPAANQSHGETWLSCATQQLLRGDSDLPQRIRQQWGLGSQAAWKLVNTRCQYEGEVASSTRPWKSPLLNEALAIRAANFPGQGNCPRSSTAANLAAVFTEPAPTRRRHPALILLEAIPGQSFPAWILSSRPCLGCGPADPFSRRKGERLAQTIPRRTSILP